MKQTNLTRGRRTGELPRVEPLRRRKTRLGTKKAGVLLNRQASLYKTVTTAHCPTLLYAGRLHVNDGELQLITSKMITR
jgi:hypothetical protein